uniref:Uncharacterized protein n=1 Tax=Oryza brachyantha TaxID=4533 RepID=J3MZQ2_ORYBR
MEAVKVLSSKLVRPSYPEGAPAPDTTEVVPSSMFDEVTYDMQMAIIYAFSPPGPSTADIERGLAEAIHDAVARVDAAYFRSFVDFVGSGAVESEALAPTAVLKDVLCPDLEVDSWLTFPFYELDFGGGSPSYFMPSYFPTEGMLFLVPSYLGDGSVDAFVPVFEHNLEAFKQCCYSMD